jgi:hypothetical protein
VSADLGLSRVVRLEERYVRRVFETDEAAYSTPADFVFGQMQGDPNDETPERMRFPERVSTFDDDNERILYEVVDVTTSPEDLCQNSLELSGVLDV